MQAERRRASPKRQIGQLPFLGSFQSAPGFAERERQSLARGRFSNRPCPRLVKRFQNSNHILPIEFQRFGREGSGPRTRGSRHRWTRTGWFLHARRALVGPLTRATLPGWEGNPGRALQPGRARRRTPFLPTCSLPVPLRKRLIMTWSGRRKFPVPRPTRPASGGLQSQQRHDIARLCGTERRPRRKKIPC